MPLSQHRTALMGLAALMVIACHYGQHILSYPFWLEIGAVGVNIFLTLSAYGLIVGLRKRYEVKSKQVNWKYYWWKRFIRIWPIFAVSALAFPPPNSLAEWFLAIGLRISTLAYYLPNIAAPFDWYLSMLPLFYGLVPLLFSLTRRWQWWIWGSALLFSVGCLLGYKLYFDQGMSKMYEYAIARIPCFVLGMCLGWSIPRLGLSLIGATLLAILAPFTQSLSVFFTTVMATPLLFIFILKGIAYTPQKLYNILCLLGRYSLPIYCGNMLASRVTLQALRHGLDTLAATILYLGCQVIFTILLATTEHYIHKWWHKSKTVLINT